MSSLSNSIDNMIADNIRIRAALAALRAELAAAQTENARLRTALERIIYLADDSPTNAAITREWVVLQPILDIAESALHPSA